MAHELNNPLTVVVGRAMQLEEQAESATDRERAQAIRAAAERCTRIVRTFLAMARRQHATRHATDLNAVPRGALELLGCVLHSGAVHVETQLDPALPRVLADADQLSQVALNLLMNAQQAMAGQPGARRLRVSSRRQGGQVRVEVEDNGPGVPTELAGRIFDPLFTTKPVGEGTGVGLAVSLGIVQAHGGTLALESPDGGGARFVVTLPVLGTEEAPAAGVGPAPADAAAGAPRSILVVDDEPEIGALLRELLEAAGHAVTLAAGGQEALERLSTQAFDVVLTDLKMPGMDGPTLYREVVRRDPALARRVVAMTGDALGGGVQAFVRQHGLPLLHKPFDAQELHDVLQAIGGIRSD